MNSLNAFSKAFNEDEMRLDGVAWQQAEKKYASWLNSYQNQYGYYDLLLINKNGDIVYTVKKEADLGENIHSSILNMDSLSKLFEQSQTEAEIQDFSPYAPSKHSYAAFFGAPIKEQGEFMGIVALQIPHDHIDNITNERFGMGNTGEVYLVGRVGTNSFYRSDRIVKTGSIGSEKQDKHTELALDGNTGQNIKLGSTDKIELVSYAPLKIMGLNWAIVVTKNFEEIKQPIYRFQRLILYAGAVLILVLLIASLITSESALRPIHKLLKGTKSIENGNYKTQIPDPGSDELGTLTRAFNHMAKSILKSYSEREQAQKVAEDASTAKDEFLASMSHELRTPLTSIIGNSDFLLDNGNCGQDNCPQQDAYKILLSIQYALNSSDKCITQ